jgi:cytochrome c1
VFTDTGCNACHTLADAGASASIGPNLDQLARRAGRRRPGLSAEEYVKQSIEDPQAFVVKGFPGNTMPKNYKQQLTSEEIDALVEYLLGVSGDQGGRGQ